MQDMSQRGLNQVPSYGALRTVPQARIRDVLNQMVADGMLTISPGRMPIVLFGSRASQTAQGGFHYELKQLERQQALTTGGAVAAKVIAFRGSNDSLDGVSVNERHPPDLEELSPADAALFERLRELRLSIARQIGKPAYVVFSDKTLRDMTRIKPVTDVQFLRVYGVGENKLKLYGQRFMEAIRAA